MSCGVWQGALNHYLCQMFTDLYSPLEKLQHPLLTDFWIKRDDLIDPYISGNKWRKLKYLLEKADLQGKNHLVTFGGAFSNHLVATAAAAARAGLRATGFVRGENVKNEMLALCRLYGMQLIFTDREQYRDKPACYARHFGSDPSAFFIDEGGASAEAVRGCAEIIGALPEHVSHICCAAGTGTTAAGLLKGIRELGRSAKLHVFPVLKGGDFISKEIGRYAGETHQLILHTDYHFGGYAKTTPELLQFMQSFTSSTGILIDPVYTAKLFFGIHDLAKKGILGKDDHIVALHTGGLLGIMGMKERFF